MQSHCLKHQERVATARCAACSIPLCDLCTQTYQDGVYCSDKCHESVIEGKARAERMAQEEEELRKWRQTRAAYKMIFYVALICGVVFGWDYLPDAFTGFVEQAWGKIKSSF